MDSFFELIFDEVDLSITGDTQVCCPFPHPSTNGPFYETNPSAGVNLDKNTFHCFSCGLGLSETNFIAKYMDLSYSSADKLKSILSRAKEDEFDWEIVHNNLQNNEAWYNYLIDLGISKEVIHELKIGYEGNSGIAFPVSLFGKIVDVGTYRPNSKPKLKRRVGSKVGMLVPYDIWREDKSKGTIICAGEKDMAIARTYGLNAITVTGGERAIPTLFINDFKDRNVYIVYDNDKVGQEGASALAVHLKPIANKVKIIDLSGVCTEKGEDLYDFFKKYNKTKEDFKNLVKETPLFTEKEYQKEKDKIYPTLPLITACSPKYSSKTVRSNVQVISTIEAQFQIPSVIVATKGKSDPNKPTKNQLREGEQRQWYLGEYNMGDILYLMDSRLKENQIYGNILNLLKIDPKEENISIQNRSKETAYKCTVSDVMDTKENAQRTELIAYSLNNKLENGKKYRLTYKLVPHPFDGQKLIMVILDVEDVDDTITNFKVNDVTKEHLKQFQVTTTLEDRINDLTERVKGMLNAEYNDQLIQFIDFWYHTVLSFNLGKWKNIRGYLDSLLVGESRTGKSSTAEELQARYGVGKKVIMPNTTSASLIGGANKDSNGSFQTRVGTLGREHKGAVILEELGKAKNPNILKEITEIKSSGVIRIGRVDGGIEVPAEVRMISITNTKASDSLPKPISSYPNGISVVTDLVGTAEDIARFDLIAVFPFMADGDIDPFQEFKEPYSDEVYRTRIRWIWSRGPDQVIISKESYQHIVNHANRLNKQFNSYIKIFGTEAWKK